MFSKTEQPADTMPEDVIFALDIGTRSIIGLVGVQEQERFIIHAAEILEHSSRAMLDGQIHDIDKVAQGASRVKEALENRLGYKLTKVSIAAAGRVLRTCRVKVERELEDGREIDLQMVGAIEMEGVQKAQQEIEKQLPANDSHKFYCVGYSVVGYYLDDYLISSLTGHRGLKAGAEVLATFLPQMVVDSLYSVMERTGLEITHLTLEPIAALNVAIPKDLRLLNLALVDIGAGTSDIAITKGGTVIAYAMAPLAGDEVTEILAQHYLVDFNSAEKIKLDLSAGLSPITFTDILDNILSVEPEEVQAIIEPVVNELAATISEKILEYNGGKAPNAIFLVGGGSQVKGLPAVLSQTIGLPRERVALRNRSIAKNVEFDSELLKGPESITPLGILVTAAQAGGQDFFYVLVNDARVRMYNSRKMTVSDALVLAGYNPEQLICKSGKSLKYIQNGKEQLKRGGFGKPAEIYVNNETAGLNTRIIPADKISIIPAEKGEDAQVSLEDVLKEWEPVYLELGGQVFAVPPRCRVNGRDGEPGLALKDGDTLEIAYDDTVQTVLKRYEVDELRYVSFLNGQEAHPEDRLSPGDRLLCESKVPARKSAEAIVNESTQAPSVARSASENSEIAQQALFEGLMVQVNGKSVPLPFKATGYLFVDIFNFIDFDLKNPKGAIILKLNGREAGYTDTIKSGDSIDIYWKD